MNWHSLARRWQMRRALAALPALVVLGAFAFEVFPAIPQACLTPTSRYVEIHAPPGAVVFIDGDRLTGARDSVTFPGEGPSYFPSLPLYQAVRLRVELESRALEGDVSVSGDPRKLIWEVSLAEDDSLALEIWTAEGS